MQEILLATIRRLNLPSSGVEQDFSIGSIFFVGTATVILRYAGLTILTDPNFLHAGDHAHLGYGMTSERLTNPAIEIDELPPLDLCILSHMHGDHFDEVAEARLDKMLPIVTTLDAAAQLRAMGFRKALGMATWESVEVNKGSARLKVTSLPATHAKGIIALALPEVIGSMLEFRTADGRSLLDLYTTGDTLVFEGLREIARRYPKIDIMLLHLGGTRILGMLVTMDAAQGIEAMETMRPEKTVPIHYNDYDVFKSHLADFRQAAEEMGLSGRVVYLKHGETYNFQVRPGQSIRD